MIIRRSRLIPGLLALLLLASALEAQVPKRDSSQATLSPVELGEVTNGFYKNASFGLSYRIPYGWV
ncbi:MAG TPA: hypothetical protein VEG68_05700, partial [Terriglobales bacterium]|nr:hypothetical protein [Terriglobales bacterium]